MRARWHVWWRLTAMAFDAVAIALALGGAALVRFGPERAFELAGPGTLSLSAPWLLGVGVWLAAFGVYGLYGPTRCANGVEEARRLVAACLTAPTAIVLSSFAVKASPSRLWMGTGTLAALACSAIGRRALRRTTGKLRRRGHWTTPSVFVGGADAKLLADSLVVDPTWGVVPVGTCGFTYGELESWDLHGVDRAVEATGAGGIVIVAADLSREDVQETIAKADDLGVSSLVVPGLDYTLMHNLQLIPLGHEPALALEQPHLRTDQRFIKRTVDIVGSFTGLVLLTPFFLLIALAIKLDSRGPAFFVQRRTGLRGKEFSVWKFRTMVQGAHEMRDQYEGLNEVDGELFKIKSDPRITRAGRLIRRLSLDELPQLWNVLKGEMSLVGPRPALPEEVEVYERALRRRLNVRPGITGLWQVSGRSDLEFEDYARLDLTYVRNWGLLLDFYILLRTLPAVLRARGAY